MSEERMPRATARSKAQAVVAEMTVDEKIAQLEHDAPAIDRLNIPAYHYWNEGLHGVARAGTATMFPQPIGMAAMYDPALVKEVATAIGIEGRAKYNAAVKKGDRDIYKGLTYWSPNVNIFRDPRWGRGHETYGEDPYLTSRNGVAFIEGLQGEGKYLRLAACAKHFAVHSGPEPLRHHFDAVVNKKDLAETYLPAFKAAVQQGHVESLMASYNAVNGVPSPVNGFLLDQTLRQEWGFEGHVVTDVGAEEDVRAHHHYTKSDAETMALAIKAGCELCAGNIARYLKQALAENLLTEAQMDGALVRLLTSRYLLGLNATDDPDDDIPFSAVDSPEHHALALKAAEKSFVLLKNDGLLPLDKNKLHSVAVIGPNADSRRAQEGNYTGTASNEVTFLEGIRAALGDSVRLYYEPGSHLYKEAVEPGAKPGDRRQEAVTAAELADVTILCLGLDATIEGEQGDSSNAYGSGDKRDLKLPATQRELLKAILAVGKPVVLVLAAGSSITFDGAEIDPNLHALLDVWYPGALGGQALANVLFGQVSPSGKLPVTFYESTRELPHFTDYAMKDRTYRYMQNDALYPFGFGLTYSQVKLSDLTVASEALDHDQLTYQVTATNTGTRPVEEVVQVYAKALDTPFAQRNPKLVGFQRFAIAPGEQQQVAVTVDPGAFQVVNDDGEWLEASGQIAFSIGLGQPDRRTAFLTGQAPLTQIISR